MKETASLKQRVMMPATKRVRRSLLTMLKILMDKMISLRVRMARKKRKRRVTLRRAKMRILTMFKWRVVTIQWLMEMNRQR